jgi:hypothetical protein
MPRLSEDEKRFIRLVVLGDQWTNVSVTVLLDRVTGGDRHRKTHLLEVVSRCLEGELTRRYPRKPERIRHPHNPANPPRPR